MKTVEWNAASGAWPHWSASECELESTRLLRTVVHRLPKAVKGQGMLKGIRAAMVDWRGRERYIDASQYD